MIMEIASKLNQLIDLENLTHLEEGTPPIQKCHLYVIDQTALLEANLHIHLAATMDVDLYKQIHATTKVLLERVLKEYGKTLDPHGHEAWMPKETEFEKSYKGKWVECFIAKAEYILISKAKMALKKNKILLIEYLANRPSDLFMELVKKYQIDLNEILNA